MPKFTLDVVVLSLLFIFLGTVNGVSGSMLSFNMPGYPSFSNYFPAAIACIFHFLMSLFGHHEELFGPSTKTKTAQRWYMLLTVTAVINTALLSYSTAWVDGSIQQVLCNLDFALVYLFSVLIMKIPWTRRQVAATVIILFGVGLGCYPVFETIINHRADWEESRVPWYDNWEFVCAGIASCVFLSLHRVLQERSLQPPYNLEENTELFWVSTYSIIPFMLLIPIETIPHINAMTESHSVAWAWQNQRGAMACAFGEPLEGTYPVQCASIWSWMWMLLYIMSFVGCYFVAVFLESSVSIWWFALLQACVPPLVAMIFDFPHIVEENNRVPFYALEGASFAVVFVGVFLMNLVLPDSTVRQERLREDESQMLQPVLSLVGRGHDDDDDDEDQGYNDYNRHLPVGNVSDGDDVPLATFDGAPESARLLPFEESAATSL
jgi:hypothetical protein